MKKLYFFLLLICTVSNAQIVNIPDPIFKAYLLSANNANYIASSAIASGVVIDTNGDGNIQVSEALVITGLEIRNITATSIEGIGAFTNLERLTVNSQVLTAMDLTGLQALTDLRIFDSAALTSINLNGLTNLYKIDMSNLHGLTTLDLSSLSGLFDFRIHNSTGLQTLTVGHLPNVEKFVCYMTFHLAQIDVTQLTNVKELYLSENDFTTLDVTPLIHLETLQVDWNELTSIDISTLVNLRHFVCGQNQLASLDLSNHPNLESLNVGINQLPSLDLSPVPQLKALYFGENPFTTIDLSTLINLESLSVDHPQLTNLDVTGLVALEQLNLSRLQQQNLSFSNNAFLNVVEISESNLIAVDVSQTPRFMNQVRIYSCLDLQHVNVKNGGGLSYLQLNNTPNLRSLCVNENSQTQTNFFQIGNPQIGTYCSFTPNGNYNTISGTLRFDSENNGCDSNDRVLPFTKFTLAQQATTTQTYTDLSGKYNFYVGVNNFSITPSIENSSYFTISPPSATVTFPNSDNNTATRDFCIAPNGIQNDVEILIVPIGRLRPGFDSVYEIVYRNKGNQPSTGTINFQFDDSVLDFVSATVAPASIHVGSLNWTYSNLLPFEVRHFQFTLNLNGPMETPAVNIGESFECMANIVNPSGDVLLEDNTFVLPEIVVGSYDPNNKICMEGNTISPEKIGDYLHYTINFENTGTAEAENIVVKDMINIAKFDMASLQLLNASHPIYTRISGNKVEFIFEGINLGAGEHGHVTFKIKTKNTLVVGNNVSNQAEIFFDYNFPIETNNETSVFQVLANQTFQADASVMISPNPASDLISVKANATIKSVALFDVQGRIVSANTVGAATSKVDISVLSRGIYLMKVDTDKGIRTQKIIKE